MAHMDGSDIIAIATVVGTVASANRTEEIAGTLQAIRCELPEILGCC